MKNLDTSLPKPVALTLRYFQNGLFCSEAVVRGFNEAYHLGLSEDQYKISTAFAGGIGESGCSCGAVTGCVMILSLLAGRSHNYESERVAFTAANKLHQKFREHHKSMCCRVLTNNFTWNTAEHKLNCEDLVRDAALITESIIQTDLKAYLPENGGKKPDARARIHRNPDSIRI